ncbi:MAG: hypothetical protein MMC23_005105 [Stictis urceolatum]|nr:hypothetical protein [Stictis urceolata]
MSALLRLRLQDEPRVFWIDAICINQEDIAERNRQVSMVREVYMKAQQLYIWLGAGDTHSTSAVELMRRLAEAQRTLIETGVYNPCKAKPEQWHAFSKFLQRGWWERMWVIQELAFAEKGATLFLCGTHQFRVEDIRDACEWCNQLIIHIEGNRELKLIMEDVLNGVKRVLVLCEMTNNTKPEKVIEGLWRQWLLAKLADTRDKKATDPRDRMFALYGFLHSEGQPVAVADYSKNVGTVFHEFALDYIISCKCLDVLSEAEEPALRAFGTKVPSWVPNWSVKTDRTPLLRMNSSLGAHRKEDHASGPIEPVIFSLNDHVLLIDGVCFDKVEIVSAPLSQECILQVRRSEDDPCVLLDLWHDVVCYHDPYPTYAPVIEAFYKTLICGREEADKHAVNFVAFWKSIQAPGVDLPNFCINTPEIVSLLCRRSAGAHLLAQMHDMCATGNSLASLKIDDILSQSPRAVSPARPALFQNQIPASNRMADTVSSAIGGKGRRRTLSAHLRYASDRRFRDLVVASATNRVLFTTTNGYIGMGVKGTSAGDIIAVLSGAKTPLILRKTELTDRRYLDKKPPRSPLTNLKNYTVVASVVGEAYVHGIMNGEAVRNGVSDRIALV